MDKSLPWRVAVCAGVGSCSGNTLVRAERCSAPTLLWKLVFAPFCRCIIPLCPSFDIVRISGHNFRTTQLGPFAYFALFILQFRFVVRLICTPLFAACPAATDHPPRRFAPPLQGWDSDQERFEVQVKQDKQDTRVPLCERSNVRRATKPLHRARYERADITKTRTCDLLSTLDLRPCTRDWSFVGINQIDLGVLESLQSRSSDCILIIELFRPKASL